MMTVVEPVDDRRTDQLVREEARGGMRVATPEKIILTSLADEIAFRVESAILEGIYPPGSRLLQDELCERFGVSRTPIREALRKLQARNLVLVVPNKGATVRVPTRKELSDVYEVRSELEGYACELAAGRATPGVIEELDESQQRIVDLVGRLLRADMDDGELAWVHVQLNRANDDFHGVVHRTADNERLRQAIQDLARVFPRDYFWRGIRSAEEMRTLNLEEHDRVRTALSEGDGAAARRAMRAHVLHARSVLLGYLDEHGFWK
jgi:DNA-binding GntR family transcriptional regulator